MFIHTMTKIRIFGNLVCVFMLLKLKKRLFRPLFILFPKNTRIFARNKLILNGQSVLRARPEAGR